ncbi:hypothetical protein B0H14DRAFT_3441932 [Mycena olivaceomarginata]|nr:hypothetical protein B0H14DRAFT_3441932 [Mycena olivaceomarginata]
MVRFTAYQRTSPVRGAGWSPPLPPAQRPPLQSFLVGVVVPDSLLPSPSHIAYLKPSPSHSPSRLPPLVSLLLSSPSSRLPIPSPPCAHAPSHPVFVLATPSCFFVPFIPIPRSHPCSSSFPFLPFSSPLFPSPSPSAQTLNRSLTLIPSSPLWWRTPWAR